MLVLIILYFVMVADSIDRSRLVLAIMIYSGFVVLMWVFRIKLLFILLMGCSKIECVFDTLLVVCCNLLFDRLFVGSFLGGW